MPEREGQRLGNYRLNRLLGKGAFAEVYLGEHLYLKSYAAIKLLRTIINEKDEQLFLSEAQTVAQLTHPNIVRVHEFAIERSTPFLVMEYAPAGTLRQRYPKGTCLSLEATVAYTKQIAAALQYAHNHGIIHRDVKPENVLQGSDHVMLSDFGISIHSPTPGTASSGGWAGTLPYMAPEQLLGQTIFASDQYALAIIVYEWLCGVRPFESASNGLAYQHINVPPPRLRDKDPSLPEAVETVVLKALSKKPGDRYVSIINFARALERASRATSSYDIQAEETDTESPEIQQPRAVRRVFLSYAPSDDIARLRTDLTLRDISVQDDTPSHLQEEQLRQAIRASQAVLLVLTPHTRASATVQAHLHFAALYRRPVLCVWAQGNDLHELLPVRAQQAMIIDARGQQYKQALGEIMAFLEQDRRGAAEIRAVAAQPDFEPRNPYKGLRAFSAGDRADFFGRTAVVQELLDHLKKQLFSASTEQSTARFLAVVGPSGSGKSSVVMAGVLPGLQEGALPGSEDWIYLDPLVPGKQPLVSLAHVLATRFPQKEPQAIQEAAQRSNGLGLHQLGLTLMARPDTRIVLLVDQFEELFSPLVSAQERQLFIDMLVQAATVPRGPFLILLTLRADFYDRPFAYPELGRLIQQHQYALLPMSTEDLREVIERPALLPDVRLTFDEELVDDLLLEMHQQAGALPLLEFALSQLFERRRGHRLTRYAYQEMGGLRGALSKHAEATYAVLPSEAHRQAVRTLFLRLVQPGAQGQEPVRRRAEVSEFELEDAEQTRLLREGIDTFVAARLVTLNQATGVAALEISHETLIREWPRLRTWLQEASEDMQLQQTLSKDVQEWERRGKPRDRLYHSSQLKELLAWQKRSIASSSEAAFLRASTARQTRTRISLFLVAVLMLGLLGTASLLFQQQQQQYAPISVTTLKDNVPGSFRQAVGNARSNSTIIFAANLKGTMILDSSLEINKNLIIRGPGSNRITLRGTPQNRGYVILIEPHVTVTISQLTLSNPTPQTATPIINQGNLTINGCAITGNYQQGTPTSNNGRTITLGAGGGINNAGGMLTVNNSTISHNTIDAENSSGGGINNLNGTLTIISSQIVDNTLIASDLLSTGGGISSVNGKVTVTNTIIAGNKVEDGQAQGLGGGIFSGQDTITFTHDTITGNSVEAKHWSTFGGGVASLKSTITVHNSTISNNNITAGGGFSYGGGLASQKGRVTITGTTISHNTTKSSQDDSYGGGIYDDDTLAITDSTISNNSANASMADPIGAFGGGILTAGTLNLNRTTIVRNTVTNSQGKAGGGGLFAGIPDIPHPMLNLTNCTIADNTAQGSTQGNGGGFGMRRATGSMDFCTIYGNTASSSGGGVAIIALSGSTTGNLAMKNSLIAGNNARTGPDIAGSITTGGYNLVQNLSDVQFNDPAHKHQTDLTGDRYPNLGIDTQLRNNGGPTPTIALQAGSPAIDAVPIASCDASTDQRGIKRPQHNACDIGAYEYR